MTSKALRISDRSPRQATWGDRPPADDDEARRRLLDAAEACYERVGVARTTVDDIAKLAAVHRTTVYRYFGSRDDVLAFVLLRETAGVITGAEQALANDGPFSERLLDALDGAIGAVQHARWLTLLFDPESLTMTVSVAASGVFRERIRAALRPHVEAAKADGTLRQDLDPDTTADWLVRVAQMLLIENLSEPPGNTRLERRALLRDYVVTGILNPTNQE
ncbi:MAG: TetR/AcrR family transcriptional regulator [Mycobacterium sp.]